MNILITGATGYVGSRLVRSLSADDVNILTLTRDLRKSELMFGKSARLKHCLVGDKESVIGFQADVVIHLATLSSSRCDLQILEPMLRANIELGVWLLEVLRESGRGFTFVNTGSFAEYRLGAAEGLKPAYLYTATKSAFRIFADYFRSMCSGMRLLTAVPYTIYGGKDTQKKLIDYLFEALESAEPVDMTAGEQVLDFVYIDDIVRFYRSVALSPLSLPEGEYHLGTGRGTKIRDLAGLIEDRKSVV